MRITTRLAAHWHAAQARRVAERELAALSTCELGDMGITRLDVSRLFEPRLAPNIVGPLKPPPQRSAVMTNQESLA